MKLWSFFFLAWLSLSGAAWADCPDLFPKLECFSRNGSNSVTLYFSTDNFLNTSETPAVNFFEPNIFASPSVIPPGFTPRITSVTVDPTLIPTLRWFLGCQILTVETAVLPENLACSSNAGPQGPQGPQGPEGPQGPPGNPGAFFSQCRTISASGRGTATASCTSAEHVLSGGASCQRGRLEATLPTSTRTWQARCQSIVQTTATAICCPL
jgi:hypothetical protein